ncbi:MULTISPECIES: alpha/beta hydrolase [unclassified Aeromicrobium]|jgi:pimeloyl-ACP methyl ester carboxylesterase|uniref:alpha/beta hydrolase n=1 Tax=unclassified Aeromicrobium TaxID=2633570 RepID=UPI000ACF62FB|nr:MULTISPECIES: alpha/beta hydrolase [unclassified Aeromicrobium]
MRRLLSSVTVAVLAAGLLTATTTTVQARAFDEQQRLDRIATPTIDWQACDEGAPAGFECASVQVPTDYDRPRGATTTVALTRLPASRPSSRKGSLFLNFGGPGGEGVSTLQQVFDVLVTPEVREHYDLVGFDPRGVGLSDPARCFDDADAEAAALEGLPAFPVTRSEERAFVRQTARISRACRAEAGDVIRHASTANVARDLELLRRAVGDDTLAYQGYSYGTYLGATYARLFPDRVGSMVLDGTVDVEAYSGANRDPRSVGARLAQGPAAEEVFDEFLEHCRLAGERCSLNALGDPAEVVDEVLERLRTRPVTIDVQGTPVEFTYPLAISSIFLQLYSPSAFSGLSDFLVLLAEGGGEAPTTLQRQLAPTQERYTSLGSSLAQLCVDSRSVLPPAAYPALADREDRVAPRFGRFRSWVGVQCPQIGLRDRDAFTGPWTQTTDATVLVIGTRFDPATPYANTRPFAEKFDDARVLTVEGYGHTTLAVSTCADAAIARYLVDGEAPRDRSTCEQDRAPFTDEPTTRRAPAPVLPAPLPGL